jgi:exopolysaccharide biosynthesis WecB/TagA/CpsF family protein
MSILTSNAAMTGLDVPGDASAPRFATVRNAPPVSINIRSADALFRAIGDRMAERRGFALATLNLDHLVRVRSDPVFRAAYGAQDFVTADGRPVAWLARLQGRSVELLPGSDMILPLARLCGARPPPGARRGPPEGAVRHHPVALLGSQDEALRGAEATLRREVPGLDICFRKAPSQGFEPESEDADRLLRELAESDAALCFLALGAGKAERLAARGRRLAPGIGFVSIGAGLDFLSGHQKRAPHVFRKTGFEWLWRTVQEPRRMIPRYARCFAILPALIRESLGRR